MSGPQPHEVTQLLLAWSSGDQAAFDPRAANIVELRFFGGLTVEETAEVTGLAPRTISREWAAAKAWLLGELTRGGA